MIDYRLDDMTCSHCEKAVRAAIAKVDPQATVLVDLETHHVQIATNQQAGAFAQALNDAGYPPSSTA